MLARRLAGEAPGTEFRAFVGPGAAQVTLRLRSEKSEQMQFGTSTFDVHHYELMFDNAGMPLEVHLYADYVGVLLRVTMPAQGIDFVRDDIAGAMSRTRVTCPLAPVLTTISPNCFSSVSRPCVLTVY